MNRLVYETVMLVLVISVLITGGALSQAPEIPTITSQPDTGTVWQEQFDLSSSNMTATGINQYFVLEPGFQLVL